MAALYVGEKTDIEAKPGSVAYVAEKPVETLVLDGTKAHNYDAAAVFFAELASRPNADVLMAPWTAAEEKAVRRKLDYIVLPLVTLSLFLGGTDKVILGTAATYGLRTDLHLVGQQYSWASSIIFFGSMLTVFPQSWLCQKFPTGKVFAFNVFFFGVMTFATIGAKNAGSLQAIRFILGLFEGMNTSGAGLVVSLGGRLFSRLILGGKINMWWRKEEQGWRTVIIFNTFSSIANGLLSSVGSTRSLAAADDAEKLLGTILRAESPTGTLAATLPHYGVSRVHASLVCVGTNGTTSCVSITVGIIDIFCLPSNPSTAWWLTDRQKYIAVQRLADNQTGMVNHNTKWAQVKEAVLDIRTWLYFLISITLNIPNGGLGGFYSIIIKGFNFSVKQTALMNIPTGVISWLAAMFWVTVARYTRQPLLCAMASVIVCLIGTIVLKVVPHSNLGGSLAALYIVYMYWAPYMVFSQLIMYANVAGTSKKVGVFGISYWGYCVGNLVGPQSFLAREAPDYHTAYTVMLCGYCVSIGLMTLYGFLCWRDNKKKVFQESQWVASMQGMELDIAEEWKDLTDKENPKFRYTY
ncbi:MFS transporter, ACS family, allantoate permease, partial [Tremellales sp. Uapishka_1]